MLFLQPPGPFLDCLDLLWIWRRRKSLSLRLALNGGSPNLGPVGVASACVSVGGDPWAWFVCMLLLLEDWLDNGGFCLAASPAAFLGALSVLGLPGDVVASSPGLATSLFRLDGLSGGGLPVAALPGGSGNI